MQTTTVATAVKLDEDSDRMMNILVIDDSEIDRQRMLRLCDNAGLSFNATEVATVADMRRALDGSSFDIVFIDYLLAGEDGLDALDLLNAHPEQRAASIMIAGEGRLDIAVEAMRRGCSDYVTKSSLSVEALQKSVATALERQMMAFNLNEERAVRQQLERSIRNYARSCSADMRSILAATLRRVRKLRTHGSGPEFASDLEDVEDQIDRLWTALPEFSEGCEKALERAGGGPIRVAKLH